MCYEGTQSTKCLYYGKYMCYEGTQSTKCLYYDIEYVMLYIYVYIHDVERRLKHIYSVGICMVDICIVDIIVVYIFNKSDWILILSSNKDGSSDRELIW